MVPDEQFHDMKSFIFTIELKFPKKNFWASWPERKDWS